MYSQPVSFVFQGRRFFEGDTLPSVPQSDSPRSPREMLPTMYDLPSEFPEEPGLPDEFHDIQPQLLSRTLHLDGYTRQNYFTASDLNVYYDIAHPLWHKRPDWFLSVNVPRLYDGDLRRSYVTWQEGTPPQVVVEFLSDGTEQDDLGRFHQKYEAGQREPKLVATTKKAKTPGKLEVYERYLRVPHYIVYSRHSGNLRYFKLEGNQYEEQALLSGNCQIWLENLQIGLGIWKGEFDEVFDGWLRWCDQGGSWLLTDTEEAQARLVRAAQNLLATGMDISQVAELLELSEAQRQRLIAPE